MSDNSWAWEILAPVLASCFALTMWLSPFPEILNVRRRLRLNDLNPLPFGFVYCNCWGFTVYGWLTEDYYVVTANFPGAALGAFYMATVIYVLGYELALLENKPEAWREGLKAEGESEALVEKASEEEEPELTIEQLISKKQMQRDVLTTFLWVGPLLWGFLGTMSFTYLVPNDQRYVASLVVGIACGVFAMSYFASPLSTMVAVCREADASSLYPPMVLANATNCLCWVIYGYFAINDPIIYGQNAAGLGLQMFNFVLLLIYPRTRADEITKKEAEMRTLKGAGTGKEQGETSSIVASTA